MHKDTLLNGAALPVGFDQLEVVAVLPALDAPNVYRGLLLLWALIFSTYTITLSSPTRNSDAGILYSVSCSSWFSSFSPKVSTLSFKALI